MVPQVLVEAKQEVPKELEDAVSMGGFGGGGGGYGGGGGGYGGGGRGGGGGGGGSNMCNDFTRGKCTRGDSCKFSHGSR